MEIKKVLHRHRQRLDQSFRRFPISVVFSFLACLLLILSIHMSLNPLTHENRLRFLGLGLLSLLGAASTLVVYLFMEGLRVKLKKNHFFIAFLWITCSLLLLDVYVQLQGPFLSYSQNISYFVALMATATVTILFVGRLYQDEAYIPYLTLIFQTFFRALNTATFLAVILLLLSLVLALITGRVWETPFYLYSLLIAYGPFFFIQFLWGFPFHDQDFNHFRLSSSLKKVFKNIFIPLSLVYQVFVYAFSIYSWVQGDLVRPLTIHLILWPSLGGLVLLMVLQLLDDQGWIHFFKKYYPLIKLPLLALLYYILIVRVLRLGVVEVRYFVILLSLWLGLVILVHIFSPGNQSKLLLQVLALFFLVATLGGPLTASRLSLISQSRQLENRLIQADILTAGDLTPNRQTPRDLQKEIVDIVAYLEEGHGFSHISYLPKDFSQANMETVFGFGPDSGLSPEEEALLQALSYRADNLEEFYMEGYDRMILVRDLAPSRVEGNLIFNRQGNQIYIQVVNSRKEGLVPFTKIDLDLLRERYLTLLRTNDQVSPQDLAIEGRSQGMDYKIYFTEVHFPPKDPSLGQKLSDKISLVLFLRDQDT
ncbi:MAG: DUF4153 domain-containing protein [Tissierellia bacterium]|nr:DUF4153 domain-containing protein [Tissierellia bacterium]